METVYSIEGWVKEVIDNENAEFLQRFNDNGMGEMGKRTLVEMAKSHFEFWRGYCKQLDTENKTAVYVHVYANVVLPNGLLCRKEHGSVYRDLVVIEPRRE